MATPADALLLISGHCPHCPAMLERLAALVKRGQIGSLEVVNVEARPERAARLGARSVPWLRLGDYVLLGPRLPAELETWARRAAEGAGMAEYFHDLLKEGALAEVLRLIEAHPARLADLLDIVANPEASLNVRLGAGAVFEDYAGRPALADLVAPLAILARDDDARVRADACHYLGLSRSAEAVAPLRACLDDPDGEVREIAQESLAAIEAAGD
jgi:hypothetical protein